jgi:hypothetical protein
MRMIEDECPLSSFLVASSMSFPLKQKIPLRQRQP